MARTWEASPDRLCRMTSSLIAVRPPVMEVVSLGTDGGVPRYAKPTLWGAGPAIICWRASAKGGLRVICGRSASVPIQKWGEHVRFRVGNSGDLA